MKSPLTIISLQQRSFGEPLDANPGGSPIFSGFSRGVQKMGHFPMMISYDGCINVFFTYTELRGDC